MTCGSLAPKPAITLAGNSSAGRMQTMVPTTQISITFLAVCVMDHQSLSPYMAPTSGAIAIGAA